MQNILYIHHTTSIGGATNSLLFTIEQLPRESYSPEVLFLQDYGQASALFESRNISIKHLSGIKLYQHAHGARIKWFGRNPIKPITAFFGMICSIPRLRRFIEQNYPNHNLVHINTSVMLPVGIACRMLGKKVVWHNREVIYPGLLGIRRFVVSTIIKFCSDRIIHVSIVGMNSLGVSAKSRVIYNFVDFDNFSKSLEVGAIFKELTLSSNTRIITMLGGTVHSKGADVFIESAHLVLKKFPNAHFVIVGYPLDKKTKSSFFSKNMSQKCKELVERLHLGHKVTFLGLRNDIPAILASTHILVWPATVPHFSRPIIEAQAMGVPSIGTHFKVTEEVIVDGVTGLFFENKKAESLAKKIITLLVDNDLHLKISLNAFQRAKENFDADKNISEILEVYKSLL